MQHLRATGIAAVPWSQGHVGDINIPTLACSSIGFSSELSCLHDLHGHIFRNVMSHVAIFLGIRISGLIANDLTEAPPSDAI